MAYSYEVPESYTVNVSLSATPTGLSGYNTNAIAIFTNEAANFSESYQTYYSPDAVATNFGSSSLTYKMAQALFTPVPNFRTGGGVLYVFPYSATNATSGSIETPDISTHITAFKNVTNGSLSLEIDGTVTEVQGLDFSNVSTVEDIANILRNQNLDVYITNTTTKIKIASKRVGNDSTIVVESPSSGTDIASSSLLSLSTGTIVYGTNATGETLAEAVTAALQQAYFGGVLTTQYCENSLVLANSSAIQAKDCVYYEALTSLKNIKALGANIKASGNSKTRLLAYSVDTATAKVAIATYASIAKSVNYSGSDTANTLNLKTLTGIAGDIYLNDTYVQDAKDNGVDIYGNTGGLSVVYSNNQNGYTDDVENDLAFKKTIEVAGWNYLRQTNTKIPQTEAGMTGLKSVYAGVCEQFRRNGAVGPGAWNSSIPFGEPETFANNITEKGYYIYSIPVALQPQSEREARKSPVVQIALKRTGAIHFADVIINVLA